MDRNQLEAARPIVDSLDIAVQRFLSGLAEQDDTARAVRDMSAQLRALLPDDRAHQMLKAIDKHANMVFDPPVSARNAAYPLPYMNFVRLQLARQVWALKSHLRESTTA